MTLAIRSLQQDKDDMLHLDNDHGQQMYQRRDMSVFLKILLLGCCLGVVCSAGPIRAEAAVLREIRMGNHGDYVRVVFEFSGKIQYEVSQNTTAGSASIRFLDTTSALSEKPITSVLDCVDSVTAFQDGSHLVANILFEPKGARLKTFTLQGPDRMVLDVSCGKGPVMAETLPEPRE